MGYPSPKAEFRRVPEGRVIHTNDETVPERQYLQNFEGEPPELTSDYPSHSRITHHVLDGVCSLAYAVSREGARKLLYELAVKEFADSYDIMLRQFCEGSAGRELHVCLTVQPTLFDHHRPAGPKSKESDITSHGDDYQDKALTLNIQWSVRMNVEKLLRGEKTFDDQYPNTS
jgi:hypothetical protein